MLEFEKFVARHGEAAAQAILENMERYSNLRANALLSLEERWHFLMGEPSDHHRLAA